MTDFFFRDTDMALAERAVHLDGMDMIISPVDGKLVPVATKNGKHVCWRCGGQFDESRPKYRRAEVSSGGEVRMLLHAGCERDRRNFFAVARGFLVRSKLAQAFRGSQSISAAAKSTSGKVL